MISFIGLPYVDPIILFSISILFCLIAAVIVNLPYNR